jgi:hypothetical protein
MKAFGVPYPLKGEQLPPEISFGRTRPSGGHGTAIWRCKPPFDDAYVKSDYRTVRPPA